MRLIWLLMLAIGIVGSNSLVLSPIAGEVAGAFAGRGATDVLMALTGYGAGTALSALVLAPRADAFGLRRALVWALSVLAGSLAVSAVAPSVSVLIAAQVVAGMAAGVILPSTYGLAAELAPAGRESETIGKVLTGWTLSMVAGVTLSALVADWLGWRVIYAAMALAAGLLAWRIRQLAGQDQRRGGVAASPLAVLRLAGLWPMLASVAAYMVAFYGSYAYLGTHLTAGLGMSTAMAGLAALSYGIGFGAIAPLDRLIDRFGSERAAVVVFAVLVLTYLLIAALSGSGVLVILTCLIWGAVNHLGLNILVGRLTALDPSRRGAIMGLYSAVTYAAMSLGIAGFRPVFEVQGFATAAILSAVCVLPALILAALARRRRLSSEAAG